MKVNSVSASTGQHINFKVFFVDEATSQDAESKSMRVII
jgi:hypothetical protein